MAIMRPPPADGVVGGEMDFGERADAEAAAAGEVEAGGFVARGDGSVVADDGEAVFDGKWSRRARLLREKRWRWRLLRCSAGLRGCADSVSTVDRGSGVVGWLSLGGGGAD